MSAQFPRVVKSLLISALLALAGGAANAATMSDFNGDGRSDVIWRNSSTGANYLYPMNGTTILPAEGYLRTVADQNWKMVAFGDFNGDGKADIFWRNASTGENYVYLMNGTSIIGEGYVRTVADQDWQVVGAGDFNGDGRADILWRNKFTGENYVYLMNGSAIAGEGAVRMVADQNWQVAGVGDFDGDGRADILWRNKSNGQNYIYLMNGVSISGEGYLRTVVDQNWSVAGVADFDGDGKADILWRNIATGENYMYPMAGLAIRPTEGYLRTVADLNWQIVALGDYNGGGRSDILWRNGKSGDNYIYFMNGTSIVAEGYVRTVADQNWSVMSAVAYTTPAGLSGAVDSSLLARHQESANLIYVFAGFGTTSGTPVATAPVIQNAGMCTFRYQLAGLPDGNYTVALTKDGGASFTRSANVTVAGTAVRDFGPARVLRVGAGRPFTDPEALNSAGVLQSGDVVEIDAGVYNGPASSWATSNITLRGVGGRAHLVAPADISNGKAIWVTQGSNTAVENIEFSDAAVPDLNGAGIRAEGPDLVVCGSYFHNNEQGILGNDTAGNILVEYSEFAYNGNCIDLCAHHVYFGHNDRVIMRYNYLHHAIQGHLIKSRAKETHILYNRVMDETDGNSSYQIDLPNGGLAYVIGNLIQKGPNTDNSGELIIFGEEGFNNPRRKLYVVNNTLVNDFGGNPFFVWVGSGSETAIVMNNLFVGSGTIVGGGGPATQTTNVQTNTPNLVNRTAFDYRPTASTPGIGQGTAPGSGDGFDLTPVYQYVHPYNREPRPIRNAIDIGAYELP
jgi:hypothetical protein